MGHAGVTSVGFAGRPTHQFNAFVSGSRTRLENFLKGKLWNDRADKPKLHPLALLRCGPALQDTAELIESRACNCSILHGRPAAHTDRADDGLAQAEWNPSLKRHQVQTQETLRTGRKPRFKSLGFRLEEDGGLRFSMGHFDTTQRSSFHTSEINKIGPVIDHGHYDADSSCGRRPLGR